jgi:MoaA/NifB/PqqE/SkfB family radical SAM enzyme
LSSTAFNRPDRWEKERQLELLPSVSALPKLLAITQQIITDYSTDFRNKFIAESPEKINKIYSYYAACHGLSAFPYKKCNAPWVSAVVESDGTVKPCFFHAAYGNIRDGQLETIINSEEAISFRKSLNTTKDDTCIKCVCYLYLSPGTQL